MKRLAKRWYSIPAIAMVAVLILALAIGGVFAAYTFQSVTATVDVEEAIVLGLFDTWDNLEPYGSVDDVTIGLGGSPGAPEVTIATIPGYAGAGFVAGEWIVIPVNFRNAGDGPLNLGASVIDAGGLVLECIWQENPGPYTELGPELQELDRGFKATGPWGALAGWGGTILGNGGKSGSAIVGAQVLFVRISAPGDIDPAASHTFAVEFSRN